MIYALIPCTKAKAQQGCTAREMYWPSPMFRGAFQVAEAESQQALVLSAKHGLLWPGQVIDPYDVTLKGTTGFRRRQWASQVVFGDGGLLSLLSPGDQLVSYLGDDYAEYVIGFLRGRGYDVIEPVLGLRPGERLAWFKRQLAAREAA